MWNYRVMKYKTIIYKDDGSILGWVDSGHTQLDWDSYDDLETTVGWLSYAFDKPILVLMEEDKLMEEI